MSTLSGHDLSALQGLKTAIYNGESDRIEEFLQQHDYSVIELRQLADIADMLEKHQIAESFRSKAKQQKD